MYDKFTEIKIKQAKEAVKASAKRGRGPRGRGRGRGRSEGDGKGKAPASEWFTPELDSNSYVPLRRLSKLVQNVSYVTLLQSDPFEENRFNNNLSKIIFRGHLAHGIRHLKKSTKEVYLPMDFRRKWDAILSFGPKQEHPKVYSIGLNMELAFLSSASLLRSISIPRRGITPS